MDRTKRAALDLVLRLMQPELSRGARYGIAAIATIFVALLKLAVPAFGAGGPDLFLTVPVAVSAIVAGFGPAIVAAIGTTLIAAYFSPPVGIVFVSNAIEVAGFFVEGLVVALLGSGIRLAYARTLRSLRRSEELERERAALIAIVDHELRNPLASLSGNLQLAARYASREDRRESLVSALIEAQQQIRRLVRIADDLGEISGSGNALTVAPAVCDVAAAAGAARDRGLVLEASRAITTRAPEGRTLAMADPTRLDQILDNLVRNAVSYSPAGSPVVIEVDRSGERVVVRVRDRGLGISDGDRARLFERFARGARAGAQPGTGLGLYLSRELARRMHGELVLEKTSPSGSTFTLTLPLARTGEDAEKDALSAAT